VCPVDCFYEGANMLVIHPDECIDCGVCEPECPVDAIKPDTDNGMAKWVDFNRTYSEQWPNITRKKPAPADADAFKDTKEKMQYFDASSPTKEG
jgi:ferredoxin